MTDDGAGTGPVLLSAQQVAERLRVDTRTVQRWSREGRLPPAVVTLGGHQKWDADEVDAAAAQALAARRGRGR